MAGAGVFAGQAGPRRGYQPLAAIGDFQQQFQRAVPAHPAQDPQLLALQRMAGPGNHR